MDIRAKFAEYMFDFDQLNEEAKEELDNGRSDQDVQQPDNEVLTDSAAQRPQE